MDHLMYSEEGNIWSKEWIYCYYLCGSRNSEFRWFVVLYDGGCSADVYYLLIYCSVVSVTISMGEIGEENHNRSRRIIYFKSQFVAVELHGHNLQINTILRNY